jgi:hypothetical protein
MSVCLSQTNQISAFLFFVFSMFWWDFVRGYRYPGIRIWSQIFSSSFHWSKTWPISNELFYFLSFQCSDETLPRVIDAQESESEVRFSLWVFIGQKLDQAEMNFSIFRLFNVLMRLCYRLSMSRNSNPRSDFPPNFHWSETGPIKNELFYFSSFRCSNKTLLEVIDAQEFESEVGFSSEK